MQILGKVKEALKSERTQTVVKAVTTVAAYTAVIVGAKLINAGADVAVKVIKDKLESKCSK